MAIKRPREETKKPASAAANSSLTTVELSVGANRIQPPPPLPPGVYFSPTKEECLSLLNRSIAGDCVLPDTPGYIFPANVYGESPDALRLRHPPASTREGDHTWWFLSEARFQSRTSRSKRAERRVGNWRLEQTKKKLDDDGLKNCFGFYTGPGRRADKTAWLMQEFTSAKDDGAGKPGVPALYRIYVTSHATDNQLRDIYGEDGVKKGPDGRKKPARAMVQEEYFDAIAALLPQGSVRGLNAQLPQAPPPPPPAYLSQYQQQQEQYLGQYYHHQQHEQYLMGAAPPVDSFGQYQQQQGPFFGVAPPLPPPASPGLLNAVAADASLDNLSMSMAEFTRMLNEQPAVMAIEEQPPEILKEEGVFGRYT